MCMPPSPTLPTPKHPKFLLGQGGMIINQGLNSEKALPGEANDGGTCRMDPPF